MREGGENRAGGLGTAGTWLNESNIEERDASNLKSVFLLSFSLWVTPRKTLHIRIPNWML
jgi:hypothetical protein